jgi:nucleotide-binding universal stress UspA family protein
VAGIVRAGRFAVELKNILVAIEAGSRDMEAQRAATRLATAAGAQLVSLEVSHGGVPAVEIVRATERARADVIVLAHDSRDIVNGTVRRARVPCLIVPPGDAAFGRLLAAVDAGPNAAEILEVAAAVGAVLGSEVEAIHVERGAPVGTTTRATAPEPRAVALATAPELLVRQGDPVVEILSAVCEEGIDLLVLGHHRGGPLNGHETGSIAPRLLERAPCAVLTVPI